MNLLSIKKPAAPRFTFHVLSRQSEVAAGSRFTFHVTAFTLIELLVVISIVGLLAGLAVPVVNNFKPNVVAGATRQLLDDVARARQYAISQRTTVFMVFVPTNFWLDSAYASSVQTAADKTKATNLLDKQWIAYNFVALRTLGDQPGRGKARYLSSWKTLPEGVVVAPQKFGPRMITSPLIITNYLENSQIRVMPILGFNTTNGIPFPSEDTVAPKYVTLPYIAFNYAGQLVPSKNDPLQNEYIPLTKASVLFQRDKITTKGTQNPPNVRELPAGNTSNAFNVVSIEWLTGRAHVERQQIR